MGGVALETTPRPRTPGFRSFADPRELADALADHVAERLRAAITARGAASLVVSGGSTPIPLFEGLSRAELAWDRTFVALADERWVDPSDSDSNERRVRAHLLRDRAAAARFCGLKIPGGTAAEREQACASRLAHIPAPFDVVLLGMGSDGHTASWFPGARRLADALDMHSGRICMAIAPPSAPHERMTLTLPALLDSREVVLHITGHAKRAVYRQALAAGPVDQLPVRAVLRQQTVPVTVWWSP